MLGGCRAFFSPFSLLAERARGSGRAARCATQVAAEREERLRRLEAQLSEQRAAAEAAAGESAALQQRLAELGARLEEVESGRTRQQQV